MSSNYSGLREYIMVKSQAMEQLQPFLKPLEFLHIQEQKSTIPQGNQISYPIEQKTSFSVYANCTFSTTKRNV